MQKDWETLVALYISLPRGTGATVHRGRSQSLSKTGRSSNPIQWQRWGPHAIHITFPWAAAAYGCQAGKALPIKRSLWGIWTQIADACSHRREDEIRLHAGLLAKAICSLNTQKWECWTFNFLQIPLRPNHMSRRLCLSWAADKKAATSWTSEIHRAQRCDDAASWSWSGSLYLREKPSHPSDFMNRFYLCILLCVCLCLLLSTWSKQYWISIYGTLAPPVGPPLPNTRLINKWDVQEKSLSEKLLINPS